MEIVLQQALHGYGDGHQLLAASVDFTAEQQAVLLVMSDLSGPAFRAGFETYLTGYPLQGTGQYCFARTWIAPELPRPGCVWTHTLIIRNDELARIESFRGLERLFSRPSSSKSFEKFAGPLLYEPDGQDHLDTAIDGRAVLRGLYASSRKVVILSDTAAKHENLILTIFAQQWPKLRRNFRFCTGALSVREGDFDLSISPPELTHSMKGAALVIGNRAESSATSAAWLEVASRDLADNLKSAYRRFLWSFGPDHVDGRAAFRPLTELYSLLEYERNESLGDVMLSAVAHFYPNPTDARHLKAELFGLSGKYTSQMGPESSLLRRLVTHPASSALEDDVASVKERTRRLADRDVGEATQIAVLAEQIGGRNATLFREAYVEQEQWPLETLETLPWALIASILENHPHVLGSSAIWLRSDRMGLLERVARTLASDRNILASAIGAMIEAQAWDTLGAIVNGLGALALMHVMEVLDSAKDGELTLPNGLHRALSANVSPLIDLLERHELGRRSLKILTAVLDPRAERVRHMGLARWARAAEAEYSFSDINLKTRSSVFFLGIALSVEDGLAPPLIAYAFSEVYEAAKTELLGSELWEELEPSLSWYSPSWDRCARLVRTVAWAFKEHGWQPSFFFGTFKADEEFGRAINELRQRRGGRRYVRRLRTAAAIDGEITCSKAQFDILDKFD